MPLLCFMFREIIDTGALTEPTVLAGRIFASWMSAPKRCYRLISRLAATSASHGMHPPPTSCKAAQAVGLCLLVVRLVGQQPPQGEDRGEGDEREQAAASRDDPQHVWRLLQACLPSQLSVSHQHWWQSIDGGQ